MARIIIRMTHAPYADAFAAEGLEFALSATNYGHESVLLFEGEGVLQLLKNQCPSPGDKNHYKRLKSAPFYDVNEVYVCEESLSAYNIDKETLGIDNQTVDAAKLFRLMTSADHIVTF